MGATAAGMALLRSAVLRPGSDWYKEARLPGEKTKVRRQHADDFSLKTVHAQIAAENVWIGIKTLSPVGVGQDHDAVFCRHRRLLLGEAATHRELNAKGREKFR